MRVIMDIDIYLCMTIPTIKRHDLDGYKEITTCISCSWWDPKYLVYINNWVRYLYIFSIKKGHFWLLLKIPHTSILCFLQIKILILMPKSLRLAPHRYSWPEKCSSLLCVFGRINRDVQSFVAKNSHYIGAFIGMLLRKYSQFPPFYPNTSRKNLKNPRQQQWPLRRKPPRRPLPQLPPVKARTSMGARVTLSSIPLILILSYNNSKRSARPQQPHQGAANEPESRLPVRGQLMQLLACLQKRLETQEAEATREREKATLERDAAAWIQNQLLAKIETLRTAQTRG